VTIGAYVVVLRAFNFVAYLFVLMHSPSRLCVKKHMLTLKLLCNVISHHGLYLLCWFIENLLRTCERKKNGLLS
jgi:hypothetical protein